MNLLSWKTTFTKGPRSSEKKCEKIWLRLGAFTCHSDCQEDKTQHQYVQACSQLVHRLSGRGVNPFYRIDWIYWLTFHERQRNSVSLSMTLQRK